MHTHRLIDSSILTTQPSPTRHARAMAATLLLLALLGVGAMAGPAARAQRQAPVAPGSPPGAGHWSRAGSLAGIGGKGISGLTIQNRDCRPSLGSATVVADFYPQSGAGGPIPITRPSVSPCGATSLYQPALPARPDGLYGVLVSSDRPIGTLERTDWTATGAAALGGQSEIGTDVVVPWVARASEGISSIVSIQNTDPEHPVTAEIEIVPVGEAVATSTFTRTIRPGTSVTLDFGGTRDIELLRLPAGFVGQLRARAATPLAAQSFVDWEARQKGVAAFEGVPTQRAGDTLYAPLVYNLGRAGHTWIAVANPSPGDPPVDITVRYDTGGRCAAAPVVIHGGGAYRIAGGAMAVFDQRDAPSPPPATGPSGLPAGCMAAATIEAAGGGKVVAAVLLAGAENGTLAAYTAGGPDDGGRHVLLPLYRNRHTAASLSTGIAAMNLGAAPATAVLEVRDSRGAPISSPCPECTQTIPPLAAYTWYPPTMRSMDQYAGSYGTAQVRADQPLAVVVSDASARGVQDTAMYAGIPAVEDPAAIATPLPGTPAATPMPTATPADNFVPIFLVNANLRDGGERPWVVDRAFLPSAERD